MRRAFTLVSVIVLGWAANAAADPSELKGSYAFTGSAVCLVAPGHFDDANPLPSNPNPGQLAPFAGFNAKLQPNDIGASAQQSFIRSFSVQGIRTFDGHGHGHVKGTAVDVLGRPTPGPEGWPHFPPSASAADFSFDFTYTVDGHGGWTSDMVSGTYTETFTAGPRGPQGGSPPAYPQTATVDAIPRITGAISNDGKTLVASHVTPTVETHTYSNGDVWPEICQRSRIFIKIGDADHGHLP